MDYAQDCLAALRRLLREPRYELRLPKPGLRHDTHPRIVPHRFPIKGGLGMYQLPHPLLRILPAIHHSTG